LSGEGGLLSGGPLFIWAAARESPVQYRRYLGDEMSNAQEKRGSLQSLRIYLQYVPTLLAYQLISAALLALIKGGLRHFGKVLIYSAGRVAVTSGDFGFIATTWQGWLFIATMLSMLFFIICFEISGLMLMIRAALSGETVRLRTAIAGSLRAIRRLLNRDGVLLCLYVALGAPLTGIGLSVPTTSGFRIPRFITAVIESSPLYLTGYVLLLAGFALFGFRNLFVLPYAVAERLPIREAKRLGRELQKRHWRSLIRRLLLLTVQSALLIRAGDALFHLVPAVARLSGGLSISLSRFAMLWIYYLGMGLSGLVWLMLRGYQIYSVMSWFYEFQSGVKPQLPARERRYRRRLKRAAVGMTLLVTSGLAVLSAALFDELFPASSDVRLIAHRLGGNAAAENSLSGLSYAITVGADGYETDVQRTRDGRYVIGHDSTFRRLCGDPRRISEMTAAQIRQLRLTNPDGTTEPPPTLEQVLDLAKGHGLLLLELKGETADRRMCDDVAAMVRERGMADQCAIISLDYRLVRYLAERHSDIRSGFVYFFAFGATEALEGDALIMEEEIATDSAIETVHSVFKIAVVWTVNTVESAHRLLTSEADAIITDELGMCRRVRRALERRSDYERMLDRLTLPEE